MPYDNLIRILVPDQLERRIEKENLNERSSLSTFSAPYRNRQNRYVSNTHT